MTAIMKMMGEEFRNSGMTADHAATYILNAVQAGEWRVLVGKDAELLDREVRNDPERVYEPRFMEILSERVFGGTGDNSNLASQEEKLALLQAVEAKSRL